MNPKNRQVNDDELLLIENAPTTKPVLPPQEEKIPEEEDAELIAAHIGVFY